MTTAPLRLAFVAVLVAVAPALAAEPTRGPALLDFHADWCGPCRQMRPVVDALTAKRFPVRSIDIDDHADLAERYRIEAVPTFVVVDRDGRELARREGLQSALDLAKLYNESVAAASRSSSSAAPEEERPPVRPASTAPAPRRPNPDPWETVVRITVRETGSVGFGSGTVIHSTDEEAVILTCAHIFQTHGRPVRPDQFDLPVQVELFDGNLTGPKGQTVRPLGAPIPGEVIDYDFERDVALVRIRPGRAVPAARVVPPRWSPRARMTMYTVGCSKGHDATAWNTVITSPEVRPFPNRPGYAAIQCQYSPIQGRSGGGLFTDDGYIAGVCNFAFDPRVAKGLYAAPASIYAILDRNRLADLYRDRSRGRNLAVADNRSESAGTLANPDDAYVRMQGPAEADEARGHLLDVAPISVPPPEMAGVRVPGSAAVGRLSAATERTDRPASTRSGWVAVGSGGSSSPTSTPRRRTDDRPAFDAVLPAPTHGLGAAEPEPSRSAAGSAARGWQPSSGRNR